MWDGKQSRSVQHRINGMASHRYAAVRCAVHVHNTIPLLIFVAAIHVPRNAKARHVCDEAIPTMWVTEITDCMKSLPAQVPTDC
jgi:hypothetical protein